MRDVCVSDSVVGGINESYCGVFDESVGGLDGGGMCVRQRTRTSFKLHLTSC